MNELKKFGLAIAPIVLVLFVVMYFAIGWKALWVVPTLTVCSTVFAILMICWIEFLENYFKKKGE
jgi:Na+/pantothenate symporter